MNKFKLFILVVFLSALSLKAFSANKCLECHAQKDYPLFEGKDFYVDEGILANSVHKGIDCVQCHTNSDIIPHTEEIKTTSCLNCHKKQEKEYEKSIHFQIKQKGDKDAPFCKNCHGTHNIQSHNNYNSQTFRTNTSKLCLKCHMDEDIQKRHPNLPNSQVFVNYKKSIHGIAFSNGISNAATCIDCHSNHTILSKDNPNAPINPNNIAQTCGKCHEGILEIYKESIHGQENQKGNLKAPVCTSCHGEHYIVNHENKNSSVNKAHLVKTCLKCHADKGLMKKFGINTDNVKNSFHGISNIVGESNIANCFSCHGNHNIYPINDIRSTINKANIEHTCGKSNCHKGNIKNLIGRKMHTKEMNNRFKRNPLSSMIITSVAVLIMLSLFGYLVFDVVQKFFKNK